MNVYDGTRMAEVLAPLGYKAIDTPELADLVLLNTCHIREKASEKVYSELGRLQLIRKTRKSDKPMIIGVAGCVAQAEGSEMMRRAPFVDLLFGPQTYHRLPEMITRVLRQKSSDDITGGNIVVTDFPAIPKFDFLPDVSSQGTSALLTIQEGCDRFCSFCVVPYTRGAEYSRPVQEVLIEAKNLVSAGARELTLLGQNVNAYHGLSQKGGNVTLAGLIYELAKIEELWRIRYTTSHPRDMKLDLILAHGEIPKLMPYLHLPIQSGSNKMLSAMNRKHTVEEYFKIIEAVRASRPDISISSDFIVGHPGETASDFEATLNLVQTVNYAQAYSFKYSARPGTPASALENAVPEKKKTERLAILQSLLNEQKIKFNKAFEGSSIPVLFDRWGRSGSQLTGRSPWMQSVHVDYGSEAEAANAFGSIMNVEVVTAFQNSLSAIPNKYTEPVKEEGVLV